MYPKERMEEYMDLKNEVSIATVNFRDIWGNKGANLEKMKRFIENAAEKGASFVVFPELALTGYEDDENGTMHKELAETIPGPSTEEIGKQADKYGIYVVFGMPERLKEDPSKIYNSAAMIGPEGKVLHVYRKAHPWIPEFAWCIKGPGEYEPVETEFGLVGLMICYDTYIYPEVARILALKGARLLFNLTAAPDYEGLELLPYMINQVKARSIENLLYVASANLVGKEKEIEFLGNSLITGPNYPATTHVYAGPASGTDEELLIAKLDFGKLDEMREAIPHFKDRRPDTYGFLGSVAK